ncbi:MAG: calcium-binding RTX family protein, partial [uncultured bacterium]
SGNDSGIGISNCAGAVIAGNYIGVAADGSSDLGNNNQGIEFIYTGGTNTVIGGDVSAEANVIAYNGNGAGEYGVKIAREASDGNQVLRNSLYLNENEGIYLAGDGANNDIAAPAITAQAADEEDLNISGNAGALETVQVFEADEDDEEGETYLAETQADGFGSWTITVPTNKLAGTRYVATTTDDTDGTSEFSPSYLVVNEAPEASPQTVSVTEDTQQTITLSGIDANADELDYSVTALPAQGSLYQTDDGVTPGLEIDTEPTVITDEHHRVIFVPEANESGAAYGNFSFQVDDGTVASAVALVTVNVSAVDDTVSTSASSASTQEDTAVTVLFSVTDPDEELLTYTIVSQPTRGSLSHLNAAAGSVRYTPSANQHGTDSFSFSVTDGVHTSNVSTVTLSLTAVNDAPLAQNSTASVDSGATVTIDLEASDVDGDSLTYQITTQPTHGTVSAFSSTNGTLTYTPESGYAGSDTIKFKVKDGSVWSSVATVSLTVSDAVNQPPVVSAGADRQVPAGARVPLKATASDDDGDTLTYLWTQTSGSQVALSSADSRNASFVAEDSLSGTTLSFQVAVTDGTDAATDHISIEVVSNEISSADALLLHEHVVGVDGGDEVISEKLEEMDAVEVSQLKLWNDCVIVATTDNPVTLLNIDARHLALGDPYADDETGTVIILDRDRLDCSTPIDFADEDLSGRTGVKVISGNQAGDRFGTTMKLGDIDGDDVFEIYVVAPGNGNGYVYGLNGVTLSIERLFIGAADKPLTSTLMEFGNFDGISGSECLFGLSVALGSDDNQTAVEDLTSLSVSAVSGFAGFSGTDAFPAVVNMAATESDYDLSSSIGISHLTKVDLDADAREDVLFGSGEACEIFILYGSDSFGAGDASVDTQVKVQCSEDTTFSTLVTSQDVTGDGFVDVIAGFPEAGDGAGRLLVLFGPLDPEQETYDMDHALVIEGVAGENLGTEVVVGDYDLDGIADLFATVLVGGEKKTKVLMLSSLLEGNSYATGGDSVSGGSGGGCSLQISNAAKTHEDWFMALNLFLVMLLSCVHRWRLESLQRNGIRRACHTIRIMPNYGIIFK